MGLDRLRIPARKLLRNPYPESTRVGLKYTLYGGKEDHEERRKRHRDRWTAVTVPRALYDDLKRLATHAGMDVAPWLAMFLSPHVTRGLEELPEGD